VGAAAGVTMALALLVCGCVFAAMAGPAVSLHLRTEALHQALNRVGPLGTSIDIDTSWNTFTAAFTGQQVLTEDDLSGATSTLASGLAASVPLAPGSWAGLTTALHNVLSGTGRLPVGYHPELEVTYRDQLTSNVQVISGRVADAAIPPGVLGVAVTQQTAARYLLHPGSRLKLGSSHGPIDLLVTAIVRARNPASTFWATDPLVTRPDLTENLVTDQFSVLAGALADPGQLAAVQRAFCPAVSSGCDFMRLEWEFPVAIGQVTADQAQAFANALAVAAGSPYSSEMESVASELSVTEPMADTLTSFITTQTAVLAVLLLLFVSLATIVVVVILLAARIVVARRDDELVMLRHRGASSRQIATLMLGGVAPAVIPAAAAGAALALAIIPGTSITAGWRQAAAVLAVALAGPPLIAVWRYRRPSPAANPALILTPETRTPRASAAAQRRLVAGLAACAAAIGGLAVLRAQGLSAAGETNWYLTAAPILVAVPAALIAMRVYPMAIRALLPVWRRRGGVAGYVGLAGAVERRTSTALPAFTLVLALTLAAFGGMVNGSIVDGQITYSWQATGADAIIDTNGAAYDVTPAVEKSIMAVPGVRHAAAVWTTTWLTPQGQQQLNVAAVDPAGYAAMTADTPFPRVPVSAFGPPVSTPVSAATVIPVLASPSAAAVLGTGIVQLTPRELMGPIRIRVAGIVARTPAEPAGGMFVLMRSRILPGVLGQPRPNLGLITGTHIDRAKLSRLVSEALPPATLSFRTDVLNTLGSAPLQHAAVLLMTLTAVIAAGLALLNLIFGLALGARDRELTLARLSVMGYERDTRLVLLMALPAVLAAFAAAAGCALALPVLVGPALDLSVFTGTGVSVQFRPDLAALGLPCVAILALIAVALITETSRSRRHGVTGLLRVQ
jgi:putative ABC transport system permease protein